jgi:glyoxylase-like metal-dependent hydrolase (beta-lactamase superfamily II)
MDYAGLENVHTIVLPMTGIMVSFNVYALVDDGLMLVDSGPRGDEALSALETGLRECGYTLADVRRLIITHAHSDHFGLASDILAISGAQVYAHRDSLVGLTEFETGQLRTDAYFARLYREAGVPEGVIAEWERKRAVAQPEAKSVAVDVLLEDGDIVSWHGYTWEVVHLPGHAPGLICLYCRETGVFLSSDHLLPEVPSAPFTQVPPRGSRRRPMRMEQYLRSLERMAEMGIIVTLPAHGQPIPDHRALIAERLAFHRQRAELILAPLNQGEKTAYQIWHALFPRIWPLDLLTGVSEIVSYLDLHEMQGRVTAQKRGDLIYYSQQL